MKIIGVIPARWASTRFEGKVLADIIGKPMIQHVWERAKKAKRLKEVFIACDDERVFKAAQDFGAKVVMTSPDHPSGTDRIAGAFCNANAEIIVNIQGDEPLIDPQVIDSVAAALIHDDSCMATVVKRIQSEEELKNPNVVKVVLDENNCALYFSRSVIPFDRQQRGFAQNTYFKHLGIYAYRKKFLAVYKKLRPSFLEETEKLEQLRVLAAGYKIKTVETSMETVGVDTPQDLEKVALFLSGKK